MSKHSRKLRALLTLVTCAAMMMAMGWWSGAEAATTSSAATSTSTKSTSTNTSAAHRSAAAKTSTGKKSTKKSGQRYKPADCATVTAAQRKSKVPIAHCFALGYTDKAGRLLSPNDGPPATALGPEDLQAAYNLPNGGEGQTVAIVDAFGYSNAEADLAVFREHYGLPACTSDNGCFKTVDQRGGQDFPADNPGWTIEAALDLDAVSSVCPKCNILLVQADSASFDDLGAAVDEAASEGAVAISNSYGYDGEAADQTSYDHFYDHPGIAVTVSSGDTGNVQSWPATNPTVVAVGGTSLTRDDSARGWHESVWGSASGGDGAGSGCSLYEPRPEWQEGVDTTCSDHKATADISADADPATGLGIYNSAAAGGWAQYGGTSLSSPLMAGMYALAGTPTPDTYPVSYPYADTSNLNDVTDGANGSCGNKLCQGAPGWDGPTGLGTPDGVSALTQGETGEVAGTVTDSDSGDQISGATVTAKDAEGTEFTATTGDDGSYDLHAPAGTYTVTASKFGYADKSVSDVQVTNGDTVTEDFSLTKQPTTTVSGYVTDASGHGWPMRAKITVDGHPGDSVYSNPYTGHYSLTLPKGSTYTLHAESADLPGYKAADVQVDLTRHLKADPPSQKLQPKGKAAPNADRTDVNLKVESATCTAPGYGYTYDGTGTDFEGWTGKDPQDGWTVTDGEGNGQTWAFNDPGNRGNLTGGSGNFAIVDSDNYGLGGQQDTSLVSPVTDLSGMDSPEIGFDTYYNGIANQVAEVDLSTDGGDTWNNVWKQTDDVQGHVDIPISDAADQSDVRVRFHFTASWGWYWELDNVFIGNRSCDAVHGGLVAGTVKDNNTKDAVNGATVTSQANSADFGVTAPTPDDANLADGYYWLFSSHTGSTKFQVAKGKYKLIKANVDVQADYVKHRNFTLKAGHLTVTPGSISVTERMGKAKNRTVTFGNDGTQSVHVKLSETDGGFTPMKGAHQTKASGAPKQVVKTKTSLAATTSAAKDAPVFGNHSTKAPSLTLHGHKVQLRQASPSDAPWTDIADYPSAVMDNAVAHHDGKTYVLGGSDGTTAFSDARMYDPSAGSWTDLADLPETLNGASAGFVGNTLYVVGGWNSSGGASNHAYAYDPGSDSWTKLADMPGPVSGAGLAVLQGKLYVIGGCTTGQCVPATNSVYSYDPGSNSWSAEPDYPTKVAFTACGGVGGEVVCAGGVEADTNTSLTDTYALVPGASDWVKKKDLPMDSWAAASAAANGMLEVMGGAINNGAAVTNQGYAYHPDTDDWTALPNSNNAVYRGGGACGIYKVGGSTGGFSPVPFGEQLPGYDQCGGGGDVSWLSENKTEFDVAPGQSVAVRVTMDSGAISQPGDYAATLNVATDSPYSSDGVDVSMHANPPKRWGKVAGTVSNADGDAIAGATVQICTMWSAARGCGPVSYTLKTDDAGHYQLWLNKGYNPLSIIAAKDGYQPKMQVTKVHKGQTTTVDFTLKKTD